MSDDLGCDECGREVTLMGNGLCGFCQPAEGERPGAMTERDVAEDAIAVIECAADGIESGMDENLIPYLRESANDLSERLESTAETAPSRKDMGDR